MTYDGAYVADFFALGLAAVDGAPTYAGDGTSGIYVWGAQAEAGAFPTSYIPTAGATATRSADIASIPTSAFGYNQRAGSVVVDFTYGSDVSLSSFVWNLTSGTVSNDYQIFCTAHP